MLKQFTHFLLEKKSGSVSRTATIKNQLSAKEHQRRSKHKGGTGIGYQNVDWLIPTFQLTT